MMPSQHRWIAHRWRSGRSVTSATTPLHCHAFVQRRHCSTQQNLESLISSLCDENNAVEAFKLLTIAKARNSLCKLDVYNKVLRSLVTTDNIEYACKLFDDMKQEVPPNHVSYACLFDACCKGKRIHDACHLLGEMAQKGFVPDSNHINMLLTDLIKQGKWQSSHRILFKLCELGHIPPLVTFNIFFAGLCRAGLMPQACKLLDDITGLGLSLDVYTYSIMIHTLCNANKVDEAHKLLKAMRNKRCMPDVVCYSTVLHGYVRLGKQELAVRTMDEMCENGCIPDVVAYNSLLSMFSKQGDTNNAYVIWEKMSAIGIAPDNISYTAMLDGLCRRNKLKECLKLLQEMLKSKLVIDTPLQRKLQECIERHGIDSETENMLMEIKESGLDLGITSAIKPSFMQNEMGYS